MIQIVTGKLGAGKTLFTVCLLYDALCKGRTVITNIEVRWDELASLALIDRRLVLNPLQLVKLNPEECKNWQEVIPFGHRESPIEVFLDEIHLFYNARDWAKTSADSRGLLSFLTQSRKAGVNVTFIAQEITTVEKQFRVLAEWELFIQSSDHIKFGPLGQSPIRFFMIVKRDTVQGTIISRNLRTYNKRHFQLYGSYTFLDSEMSELWQKAKKIDRYKLEKITHWQFFKLNMKNLFLPLWRWLTYKPAKP